MNGKLIFLLSLFGLAMGVATVYVIPSRVEPAFWLVIFVICAVLIARAAPGRFFLHGLLVSMLNSVWITGAHILLADAYLPNHPEEAAMLAGSTMSPRLLMLFTGPMIGVASGLVLGLFAYVASRLLKRRAAAAPAP